LAVAAPLIALGMGLIYLNADMGSCRTVDSGGQATLPFRPDATDEEMERCRLLLLQRVEAKRQMIRELLAGHRTLMQAAVRYRDIGESMRLPCDPPRSAANDAAEGERVCRVVIKMATNMLQEDPLSPAAELTARLTAELERHRGSDGVVRLPD
jgi:hypothetical protein